MLGGEAGDIPLNPDGTPAEIIHEKEEVEVVREVEKVVEKEVIKYEGRCAKVIPNTQTCVEGWHGIKELDTVV